MNYLKRKYNLLVANAQRSRSRWRSVGISVDKPLTMEIKGRNLIEGCQNNHGRRQRNPRVVERMRLDHHECDSRRTGTHASRAFRDISDRGIVLTEEARSSRTRQAHPRRNGIAVSIADDPLCSVVLAPVKCSRTSSCCARFRLSRAAIFERDGEQ